MLRRALSLLPATALVAVAALLPGMAVAARDNAPNRLPKPSSSVALRPVTPYTTAGVLKLLPAPPPARRANREAVEEGHANPEAPTPKPRTPYHGPALGGPTALAGAAPGSDQAPSVSGPGASVGGGVGMRANAREQSGSDLVAFRVSEVANVQSAATLPGASNVNWISDATVANDRNAVLYTANWFAAFSSDNGMTWGYFDPASLPTVGSKKSFCCDQYAVSVPRDGYSNVVWLLQYNKSSTNNGYRVVVLKNRSGVESLGGSLEYCSYEIWSDRVGLPSKFWMDYPSVQASSKYLYVTANAGPTSGNTLDRSVIWRTPVSGLDDCSGGTEVGVVNSRLDLRPINGAGTTMYFGTNPRDWTFGSRFDIGKVPDSSNTVSWTRRDITNFPTDQPTCVVTGGGGNDPCGRLTAGQVLAGYLSSTRLGFALGTGSGSSSTDYPYVRVLRFDPGTLALTGETDIWNPDLAWILPSSGVNARGDVGGTMTALGGSTLATVDAFMSDNYSDWSPVEFAGVAGSTDAALGSCSSSSTGRGKQCMGDYLTSASYTGCGQTFAASATVERTITTGQVGVNGPSDRFAWFGRQQDGCVDLQVSDVQVSAAGVRGGGTISIGDTTWNSGGVGSSATTTQYYLSRDDTVGGTDVVLGSRGVGAIAAGTSSTGSGTSVTLPATAFGTYVVIACADSANLIDEVSDTNNCAASGQFDVQWTLASIGNPGMWARELDGAAWKGLGGAAHAGGRIQVTASGRISPVINPGNDPRPDVGGVPPVIPWDIFLTVDARVQFTAKPIGKIPTGPLKPRTLDNGNLRQWVGSAPGTAVLPARMPAGRYWVRVCTPVPDDDPVPQRACTTAKQPIIIAQKAVRAQARG